MKIFRTTSLFFVLTLLSFGLTAQKKVCITIDDLPVVGYGMNSHEDWKSVTQKLIATFKAHGIPAIGYVNENKLYNQNSLDSGRLSLLRMWLSNGYELGNHTFSHIDYHKSSFDEFAKNINKGEVHTRPLMAEFDQTLKYFRPPYLRAGNTQESSEALESFLEEKDYVPSPVTLDSDDYLFALAYARAVRQKKTDLAQKIGLEYVSHTEKKLQFYEQLSTEVFGRNIAHTYLMHANLLNADYLDELATMFEKNGYTFISQTEVLEDPAYDEPVTKFGNWGMSWLYRWALSKDKGTELFKTDIQVPDYIRELTK